MVGLSLLARMIYIVFCVLCQVCTLHFIILPAMKDTLISNVLRLSPKTDAGRSCTGSALAQPSPIRRMLATYTATTV